jgi:metacaspase-1
MRRLAVCIGINDYPGTDNDLAGCVNDAEDWAAALAARGFAVERILDARAKKKAMCTAIDNALRRAEPGDSIIITYSGHGSFIPDAEGDEPDGIDEILCPWDIDKGSSLSDDELNALFSRVAEGVRLVMIADSCHSGTVSRVAPRPPCGTREPKARFMPPGKFLMADAHAAPRARRMRRPARARTMEGALLLAGCQDAEYSYDAWFGERANGAFTHAALKTLAKLPPAATYADWYKAIRAELPSKDYPQTPNLYGTAAQKKWPVLT